MAAEQRPYQQEPIVVGSTPQLLVDDWALDLDRCSGVTRRMVDAFVPAEAVIVAEDGKEVSEWSTKAQNYPKETCQVGRNVGSNGYVSVLLDDGEVIRTWYWAMNVAIAYAESYDGGYSFVKPSLRDDGSNYVIVHNESTSYLRINSVYVRREESGRYYMTACQHSTQHTRQLVSEDGFNWWPLHIEPVAGPSCDSALPMIRMHDRDGTGPRNLFANRKDFGAPGRSHFRLPATHISLAHVRVRDAVRAGLAVAALAALTDSRLTGSPTSSNRTDGIAKPAQASPHSSPAGVAVLKWASSLATHRRGRAV